MREKGNARGSSSSTQLSASLWVQEKGNRNKRKFLSDPPLGDPNKLPSCSQNEHPSYEFSAEGSQSNPNPGQYCLCQMCRLHQDVPDAFQLEVKLTEAVKSSAESGRLKGGLELVDFQDADWSDLTESQLEELCLNNLDMIFNSAIKKIAACGYSEDVVTKAVLRSDLCYGCKDTVSNIVDNTLAFLQTGKESDAGKDHFFENLEQLEKYILAEMVCVLREVRPFFSTGDAMWCLLICDMNVSHACAMEGDPLNGLVSNEASGSSSSVSALPETKSKGDNSEDNVPNVNKSNPLFQSPDGSQSETSSAKGIPNLTNPNSSHPVVHEGLPPEKESPISTYSNVEKSLGFIQEFVQAKSQPSISVDKSGGGRKGQAGKRESILRQKSFHLEKNYRGSLKTGKLGSFGGLILDKKPKAGTSSTGISPKNAPSKVKKAVAVNAANAEGNQNLAVNASLSSASTSNQNTVTISSALPTANTELSLSVPSKSNVASDCFTPTSETHSYSYYGIPFDKTTGRWVPRDEQDKIIMQLVSRRQELRNELQEWTEWANHKVMQAARRLGKDKAELKTLRQEKEEAQRFLKERQALEESTVKKLTEMENALSKATAQVERANAAVQRLEAENGKLRQEMDEAKVRATESAASCQEVSKRENKMRKKFQSWEKHKAALQEDVTNLRRERAQLEQEVRQAQERFNQVEARWKQEEKAKEEYLMHAESIRKEREQIEATAEVQEEIIKLKAENDLKKYKDDARSLETQMSQLRLKTDPPKALQWDVHGRKAEFQGNLGSKSVRRERECVMCLAEERSVIFLPCAHQVVCSKCNELHEKHGMKECPSCRTPIQSRFFPRFARP